MEIRDDAVERAKAINEAVARFTKRKLEVPPYLAGLAARLKPVVVPAPEPEPAPKPEPAVVPEPAPVEKAEEAAEEVAPAPEAATQEVQAVEVAASDTATEDAETPPVVRRGRPPRR